MGHIFTTLKLSNPRKAEVRPITINALADTGALMMCLPEHIVIQLELDTQSFREVSVADGRRLKVPYVGHIKIEGKLT